jgi:hypothetical protein
MAIENKVSDKIKNFQKFAEQDVSAAISELKKIKKDENRKHLQRLVYANLIDRFDVLIDELLLELATLPNNSFHTRVLLKVSDIPVSQKDFYEVMVSNDAKKVIEEQIKNIVRSEFIRSRHSAKLRVLLEDGFEVEKNQLNKSRVNANDGRVQTTFKRRSVTVPSTVIGYSDYLYARRSGIVHGTGTSISKQDTDYLTKTFDAKTKAIGIKLSSVLSAAQFYKHLTEFMLTEMWPPSRNHQPKNNKNN